MIRKAFVNKKTKQYSVTIPKKEISAIDPTLKYNKDLFVRIRILKSKPKKING